MAERRTTADLMREMAPLMNLGVELTATVCVFGLLGWFIDDRAHTKPLWFAILLGIGAIVGMVNLIRRVMKMATEKQKVAPQPVDKSSLL